MQTDLTVYLKRFSDVPNIGDVFSASVIAALTGARVRSIGEEPSTRPNLIAAGSIAHWSDANSTLWGCGLINDWIELGAAPRRVLAVRGQRTRDILTRRGISCGEVLGDPAILLPERIRPAAPTGRTGLVPHYVDREAAFTKACAAGGIEVLDVFDETERFVEALTACERVLSSSLHGIVIAHAYGIPAAWVEISGNVHGDGFKFFDYYSSIGVAERDVPRLRAGRDPLESMLAACAAAPRPLDAAALRAELTGSISSVGCAA